MVNEKRRGFSVPALLFFFFLSSSPPNTAEKKRSELYIGDRGSMDVLGRKMGCTRKEGCMNYRSGG